MTPADLVPDLSHQESMIPQPKLSHTTKLCDEVSCDDTGCRPVGVSGLSRVVESDPSLIDTKTGDRSHGDIVCGPLEEGR